MVTGDSQEEVMIFRYKQTHRQTLIIIYISSSTLNRSSLTEHNDWFDGEEEETDAEPRETEYEDDMTVIKDH